MDKNTNFQEIPASLLNKFKQFPPLKLVEGKEFFNRIENVYLEVAPNLNPEKPTLLVIIGPSGGGKDSSMKKLIQNGFAEHVVTATTRPRRVELGEPEDAYVWINDPMRPGEEVKDYEDRIAETYNLVEHDGHHGAVYGLPMSSLEKVKAHSKVGIIRTETNGLKTIKDKLEGEFNIISVFITADSYETLAKRIQDRNNYIVRMEKAPDEIRAAKGNVNFIIINPEHPMGREAGEEEIADKLQQLFDSFILFQN